MPAASARIPTAVQGRRILSKITSPFAVKGRNIVEFFVQAEDPHRQYSPGDTVRGSVILKVAKPTRITHLVVCLHGFVQVFKTPGSPHTEGFRAINSLIGNGSGKKKGEYYGNGFATLFEDEIVVCGDGRLPEGSYSFEFEVTFPNEALPSSIDFERGTISYIITATMTRPTTMAPVTFHDQKIFLAERIDIAPLLPPNPRTITLEPIARRTRPRTNPRRVTSPTDSHLSGDATASARQSMTSSVPTTSLTPSLPRTPSVSEFSLETRISSNDSQSLAGSARTSQHNCDSLTGKALTKRLVTATIETLKGGCLRGDSVPVKIVINHTKHIKSLHGVIITLYRQARVDMHPLIPLGPVRDGDKRKYEDYYPKSLTGLGGLSLSGAGSSHVFRKDFAQVFLPLIVDPQTLIAEVNTRIRVPEDAFPTVSTVPGGMISFKYYIEVVLDIQGKLNGPDRFVYQADSVEPPSDHYNGTSPGHDYDQYDKGPRHLYGPSIVDTAPIRRDKSVITCVHEVVIGTHDSEKTNSKGKARAEPTPARSLNNASAGNDTEVGTCATSRAWVDVHNHAHNGHAHEHSGDYPDWRDYDQNRNGQVMDAIDPYYDPNHTYYPHPGDPNYVNLDYCYYDEAHGYPHDHSYVGFAPPPGEPEEGLSEKEQLRRAEARLLPSQPPLSEEYMPHPDETEPSAPILEDEDTGRHFVYEEHASSARRAETLQSHLRPSSATSTFSDGRQVQRLLGGDNWPRRGDDSASGSANNEYPGPVDDKQELRAQQLQLEASAPSLPLEGEVLDMPATAPGIEDVTVPVLTDDDDGLGFGSGSIYGPSGYLPRYER